MTLTTKEQPEAQAPELSEARKRFLHTVFVTALEGGIGYWSRCSTYHWLKPEYSDMRGYLDGCEDIDGFYAEIIPGDPDGWGIGVLPNGVQVADHEQLRIDLDVMERGVLYYREHLVTMKGLRGLSPMGQRILDDIDSSGEYGDIDAGVADVIVQYGLFGTQVYG